MLIFWLKTDPDHWFYLIWNGWGKDHFVETYAFHSVEVHSRGIFNPIWSLLPSWDVLLQTPCFYPNHKEPFRNPPGALGLENVSPASKWLFWQAIYVESWGGTWGGTLVRLLPFGVCFFFKIFSAQTSCHKTSCWNGLFSGCYFLSLYVRVHCTVPDWKHWKLQVLLKLSIPIETTLLIVHGHWFSHVIIHQKICTTWDVESPVGIGMNVDKLPMLTVSGSNWMKQHKCNRSLDVCIL